MNQRVYKDVNENFKINLEGVLAEDPLLDVLIPYLDNEVDIYFPLVNEMNAEGTTTKNILNSSIYNPQLNQEPGIINKEILYRFYDISTNGLVVNNRVLEKYKEDENLKHFGILDLIISNFSDLKVRCIPKCIVTAIENEIPDGERKEMVEELKSIYNKNEKQSTASVVK